MTNNLTLFKNCLALYPTGVTAVTLYDNLKNKIGVTISSFSSLSLEPQMVMFALKTCSFSHQFFKKNTNICINILANDQKNECLAFTKPASVNWQEISHTINKNFIHLTGAVAHIHCSVEDIITAGDHSIIVSNALNFFSHESKKPLIYCNREFSTL